MVRPPLEVDEIKIKVTFCLIQEALQIQGTTADFLSLQSLQKLWTEFMWEL